MDTVNVLQVNNNHNLKVEQLQSRYFLKKGVYCIEYKFRTKPTYGFTKLKSLWVEALGVDTVNISKDLTEATYFEYSNDRANKWSKRDLEIIFEDLVYEKRFLEGKQVITPEKFLVKSYSS